MNSKTFAVIYVLIILTGFLSIVTLLEYHTTIISHYSGFVEVYQEGNEYIANRTRVTVIKDVYLFKTNYLDIRTESFTLSRGTNASQIIQSAIDQAGTIFFHSGIYNMTSKVWVSNNTYLIGDFDWTAQFTRDKFYIKPDAQYVIFQGLNATLEP